MPNDEGWVHAPVSIDDVESALTTGSHDLATLCQSTHVNPYSLIGPVYSDYPTWSPADLKKIFSMGPVPTPDSNDWHYELCKWGYYVPCVHLPTDIDKIKDKHWVRNKPSGNSYNCLALFDGYWDTGEPTIAVSAEVHAGSEILVFIHPPQAVADSDILSSNGINNPGGIVGIKEVLGYTTAGENRDIYLGCLLKGGGYVRYFQSEQTLGEMHSGMGMNDSFQPIVQINTGITANSNTTYKIIPYATDKKLVQKSDGTYEVAAGAICYSLKFGPKYQLVMEYKTKSQYTVAFSQTKFQRISTKVHIQTYISNATSSSVTVGAFKLKFTYQGEEGPLIRTSSHAAITVPANSRSELLLVSFTDNTLFNESNWSKVRSMFLEASWGGQTIQSVQLKIGPNDNGSGTIFPSQPGPITPIFPELG